MTGYKGKQGRKGFESENKTKRVIDMSIHAVLRFLNNPKYSDEAKARIGAGFVMKAIPTKIEGELEKRILVITTEVNGEERLLDGERGEDSQKRLSDSTAEIQTPQTPEKNPE